MSEATSFHLTNLIHYQKNDPKDALVLREAYRLKLMDDIFRKAPQPRTSLSVFRGMDPDMLKEGPYDYYLPSSRKEAIASMFGPPNKIRTTPRVRYLDIHRMLPGFDYQDPNFTIDGSEHEVLLPRGGIMKRLTDDEWLYDYLREYSNGGYVDA